MHLVQDLSDREAVYGARVYLRLQGLPDLFLGGEVDDLPALCGNLQPQLRLPDWL